MRLRVTAGLLATVLVMAPALAQQPDPYFREAQRAFTSLEVDNRLWYQLFLTSAGYWPSVPNVSFSRRLYEATRQYQQERGEEPTGALTKAQLGRVLDSASSVLKGWQVRWVPHPQRGRKLWLPTGLDLQIRRTERGIEVKEVQNRFRLAFNFNPGAGVQDTYETTLREMVSSGDNINFKVMKRDFFVITGNQGRYNRYVRYHEDGGGILGFDMSWSTDDPPIYGSRLVTVVSGSLWATMTGAPFPSVARGRYPWEEAAPEVASLPVPKAPAPAAPPASAEPPKATGSTGSGFFVSKAGHILTNAHVVDGCATITARPDGTSAVPAEVLAKDTVNDLAVLKVAGPVEKTLTLRPSVRLGEGVAAFGFPHTNMLATTGNFTLGNVTALAGLKDDSRYLQISAPVQSGNSGGPLLDGSGAVVGVVSAKLNAAKVMASSGDLPQNVNFAVKSALAVSFLDANRVAYETGAATEKLDPADLAERAKAASVFVRCQR